MARVQIIREVTADEPNDWQLCFQWCEYIYDDDSTELGYRFIWRRPDGSLQAARGQARIPDVNSINQLMELARVAGWLGIENG
jgi:hypothetical protein